MRNTRLLGISLVASWATIALGSVAPLVTHAEPLTVTIIHVNDWDRMGDDNGHGGAARIAAVVKAERTRAEAADGLAVVTFGGDMISPSVLSGIDRGAHMIDLANAVGFDVAVPGNHEFDFGPEVLQERLAESNAVWLVGNIDYLGRRGFPGTQATTMIEKAGYRLGFLGLITPDTAEISAPESRWPSCRRRRSPPHWRRSFGPPARTWSLHSPITGLRRTGPCCAACGTSTSCWAATITSLRRGTTAVRPSSSPGPRAAMWAS